MLKGTHCSEETKRKMSETRIGNKNGFYGKHHSEETKKKLSEAKKGNTIWLGRHHTQESKEKLSKSLSGKIPWNKGMPHSEETLQKISNKLSGRVFSEDWKLKLSKAQKGNNNGNWKGGKIIKHNGYIMVKMPEHSHCDKQGYVAEHRLVMETHLGRYLLPDEVVHHEGDKDDNRIEKLMLFANSNEHLKYHREFKKQIV